MFLDKVKLIQVEKICALAEKEFEQENYDKALELYKQAKGKLPQSVEDWEASTWVYVAIGDCYFIKTEYKDALYYFKEALKLPNGIGNAFILLRLGQCYYELNDSEKGHNYLLQAYMVDGYDVFENEDNKYLKLIENEIKDTAIDISENDKSNNREPMVNGDMSTDSDCRMKRELDTEIANRIESLRVDSFALYKEEDLKGSIALMKDAWELLPDDKCLYKESFLIATFMLRLAIEDKDNGLLSEWRDIILKANPWRLDSGEREMWAGRASYHLNELEQAKYYFSLADKKSKGRCFREDDGEYKQFYSE